MRLTVESVQSRTDFFLLFIAIYYHDRESRDFKTITTSYTIEKPVDSGETFVDISVNTGQICMGFEADTPEK